MPINDSLAIMYWDQRDVRFDCFHFIHWIVVAFERFIHWYQKQIFDPFVKQAYATSATIVLQLRTSYELVTVALETIIAIEVLSGLIKIHLWLVFIKGSLLFFDAFI